MQSVASTFRTRSFREAASVVFLTHQTSLAFAARIRFGGIGLGAETDSREFVSSFILECFGPSGVRNAVYDPYSFGMMIQLFVVFSVGEYGDR